MIGTIYRITTRAGQVVQGRVQGSGGLIGHQGPRKSPGPTESGRVVLQRIADGKQKMRRIFQPAEGFVRVYPHFSADSNGPHVDVDIRGATVEIVDVDTDEKAAR